MPELLGLEHVRRFQLETTNCTIRDLPEMAEQFPKAIDSLFKVCHFLGPVNSKDVESAEGQLFAFCYYHYLQFPYTIWSIFEPAMKGSYLEAMVLYRHMVEIFIQMKYFHCFPDKFPDHWKGTKRVRFRRMFDQFSKGY